MKNYATIIPWARFCFGVLLSSYLLASSLGDCVDTPSGLVGWWPGDGNASNLLGTNHGTLQGGATASAVGAVGNSFSFDGTNGYVQIPNSPLLQPANLTIEAWVKFDSLDSSAGTSSSPAGDQYIVFKQNTRSTDFEGFDLSKTRVAGSDYFRFLVAAASGQFALLRSVSTISTGVWYHVAAVRGSNFAQLYVNGVLQGQTNVSFAQSYGTQPLYFGTSGQPSWDHKLKGNLDEVAIYNRALSGNEIASVFAAGAAGRCKGPEIISQPHNASVALGGRTNFSVVAKGFAPLSYQWRFHGTNIPGATSSILALSAIQLSNAGNYSVVITNFAGLTISQEATLIVGEPPVILQQPLSQLCNVGSNIIFSVAVNGTPPFTFQWRFHETNILKTEVGLTTNFSAVTLSNVTAADVGNYGVLVTNLGGSTTSSVAQLLFPGFSPAHSLSTGVFIGHVSWADYDNDGDLDLFVTGHTNFQNNTPVSQLYRNEGNTFTPITTTFPNLYRPSADWGDFDNDGDLDLVIKGTPVDWNANDGAWVYRNDGNGQFVLSVYVGSYYAAGSVQWADLDNDGKLDIVRSTFNYSAVIRNNGDQTFGGSYPALIGVEHVQGTTVTDFDNDGDLDIFLVGSYLTRLYQNAGGNLLTNTGQSFQAFSDYQGGGAAWSDYNNDGYEDMILSGAASQVGAFTRLYRNNAGMLISNATPFLQLRESMMAWGDVDNDGRTDLFLGGNAGYPADEYVSKVYQNSGQEIFTDMGLPLPGMRDGSAKFGDYDNDGVLDLVLIGLDTTSAWTPTTRLYHGNFQRTNSSPTPPSGLNVTRGPNAAILSWSASTDAEQSGGLSYNVRIGTTPGGIEVLSPMANTTTGFRLVPKIGNARYRQFLLITNLPAGTYYWSVQAIDHAFKGSTFSAESSFTLPAPVITDQPQDLTVNEGMPATLQVSAGGAEPLHYQWFFNGISLNGATNAYLTIASTRFSDQGNYTVTITNEFGSITSTNVTLTVLSPPAIAEHPLSQTNGLGSAASFSGGALGSLPISYQWYYNGSPIPWTGKYWGTTSNVLTIIYSGPEDAGDYTLVASNAYGYATTAVASLTVRMPTALLNVDFGVGDQSLKTGPAAIGQTPNDFWNFYNSTNTGLTNLLLAPQLPTSVKVILSGPRGPWTNANPDPMFGVYLYQNGLPGVFQVTTEGLPSGSYDLFYYGRCGYTQEGTALQMFVDGVNKGIKSAAGTDVSGNFGDTSTNWVEGVHYVLFRDVALTSTSSVKVVILNGYACFGSLAGMQISPTLTKPQIPLFWTQPKSGVYPPGTNFQLGTTVTGKSPNQYQWFRNGIALNDDGQVIGAGSNVLSVTSATTNHTGNYWLVATNPDGVSTSAVANVFVGLPPTITQGPLSRTNITGTTATFTASIGGTPPFEYRWQRNGANLTDNVRVQGSFTPLLTISNLLTTDAGQYRLVVTNGAGSITSLAATLTVYAPPTFETQPASKTVMGGNNLTLAATATGTTPLRYQWQKDGSPLPGANSPTLRLTSVKRTNAGVYSVTVTNIAGTADSSNAILRVLVPQRFTNSVVLTDGTIVFHSLDSDGGSIPSADLMGFQVMVSTNLSSWEVLTNALSVTNGFLRIQDSNQIRYPARFYRVLEH